MNYDTSVLTFVSILSPDISIFTSPMVTLDSVAGSVSANAIAQTTASLSSREGTMVYIATVTFSISSNAPGGLRTSSITNLRALFLVNINSNQFVGNSKAHVYDYVGINHVGSVSIQISPAPVLIGGYAYPISGAYIIIKPSGTSTSIAISGIGFR